MTYIDGGVVVFSTAFGTKGFATIQPGEGISEEQISFTGITQNSNGTATLTGVSSVLFISPYTETSGLAKTHAGSTTLIISNTAGFYNELTSKDDDETINGIWTFVQSPIVPTGGTGTQAANNQDIANAITGVSGTATNTTFGTVKLSVAAASAPNPIVVGDNDTRVSPVSLAALNAGEVQALVGTSGTPSSSNKYVTDADTTGTGAVQRASVISGFVNSSSTFVAGATITSGQSLHISPFSQSDGGILLDVQTSVTYSAVSNQTQSFTVASNSNRGLLVSVISTAAPSGITYNAVAMTLVTSSALSGGSNSLYVYKLIAPSTGTNNIVVTGTGINGISGASYYNVDQVSFIEAFGNNTVTTTTQGAFLHIFGGASASGAGIATPSGTFTTKYSASASATVVGSTNGSTGITSASASKINEVLVVSTAFAGFVSGGSGTVGSVSIGLSIKAFTAVSIGVVPSSSAPITANEPLIDFIGFATTSVSAGASIVVTDIGTATGLSGLTAGKKYYLQDTAGTIGTTRGSYGKVIGKAVSTTTLFIAPEKTMGAAITKTTAYTYTAETDGTVTVRGANTIITDGVTFTGVASATMSIPVSRNKTYVISGGTDTYLIPIS